MAKKKSKSKRGRSSKSEPPPEDSWPGKDQKVLQDDDEIRPYLDAALQDHPDLEKVRFLVVFRKSGMSKFGSAVSARVSLIPDAFRLGSKADVLIEVGWHAWQDLSERVKTASIHEQLCYLWRDERSGVVKMKQPDFWGFHQNVQRFGVWNGRLKELQKTIQQLPIRFPGHELGEEDAEGTPATA